jgi:hypothetical protein
LILKDESNRLVSCLHLNLKNQNEAFIHEKNQLYEFIDKISLDYEELIKKYDINDIEIPSINKFLLYYYLYYLYDNINKIKIEILFIFYNFF